jgi:hypothetical protein
MKKPFTLFIILISSFSLRAQIFAEFTWCPVYDTTSQMCCIQFEDLSVDSAGAILTYFWSTGDGGSRYVADAHWCYAVTGTYEVILIVTGPSGTDTVTHFLTINHLDTTDCNCDSLIGINEIDNSTFWFSMSPNPFHEKTTVTLKTMGNHRLHHPEIKIYNSIGALIRTENISLDEKQEFILERKSLVHGLYHFVLSSESLKHVVSGKFMIE